MSDFHNTLINMLLKYLQDNTNGDIEDCYFNKWNNTNGKIEDCYVNKWNNTPCQEIYDLISESFNHNFEENYPDFDLNDMTVDTVLEIQKEIVKYYGIGTLGDDLFKKDYLVRHYIMRYDFINEIAEKYDIIKIQRLWRGYDCRWKNPFLMLKC